jgi:hypothetical protein
MDRLCEQMLGAAIVARVGRLVYQPFSERRPLRQGGGECAFDSSRRVTESIPMGRERPSLEAGRCRLLVTTEGETEHERGLNGVPSSSRLPSSYP